MQSFSEKWRTRATAVVAGLWLLAASRIGSRWGEESLIGMLLFTCGCMLTGIGVIGRTWCLACIAGRKNGELVTDGPYSLCRNPLYLFSALGAAGVGLASCTFTFPLLVLVGFGLYYPSVVASEGRRLLELHNGSYLDYQKSTPSLLPSFSNFHESSDHLIQSRAFRSGAFDLIWFFVAFAWMHIVAELHRSGHIVPWYLLP